MKNIQVYAKALLEQIEVARVRQLSGLKESVNIKYTDTSKAISLFQKYVGLDQTGVPDPKTMHMIKMVAEDAKSAGQAVGQAVGGAADWLGKQASSAWSGAKNLAGQAAQGVQNFAAGAQQGAQQAMTQPTAPAAPTAKPKTAPDPKVLALQKDLISKGAKIKADGIMGPATQAAQKQFSGAKPQTKPTPPVAAPAAGDAAKNPVGTTNAATAIPTGGLENPANQAKSPAASGKIDWAGSEKGTPLTPDASANAKAAGIEADQKAAGSEQAGIEKAAAPAADPVKTYTQQEIDAMTKKNPAPAAAPAVKNAPKVMDKIMPAAAKDQAPGGPQTTVDDDGNTTITRPDGSSMVVGPDGKQIMPGSNPNLPQNQGAFNKLGNWLTNKGQYQKPGGFQPPPGAAPAKPAGGPPDMGVSGESVNYSNQRMVEDPELTAMLRIAGLR